jgi:geranylgeranyl diphosphate synthase type I
MGTILELMQGYAKKVEEELNRLFPPDLEPLPLTKASRHLIDAGGKRFRPCLALAACEAVGGRAEDALETAAALEFLHSFTLIHDDIMDRDEFRRNVKTVHTIWGEPIAIIAGDALFAKVFEAIAANLKRIKMEKRRAIEIFDTISKASFEICQGQALDMLFEGRWDVGEDEYLKMVSGKTGALTEASTKVGALLGGGGAGQVRALADYGRLLGIAFQIKDDILGIAGKKEKFGKPIGSDIREGKRTLIALHALKNTSKEKRKFLLKVLGNKNASEEELHMAIEIMKEAGSVNYASRKAREFIALAKSKIAPLPASKGKDVLLKIADFTVEREF